MSKTTRKNHKQRGSNPRDSSLYKNNRRLILKDKPLCHWCNLRDATTADHLIEIDRWPQGEPGINSLDNLVAACKMCNSARGARYGNLKRKNMREPSPTININKKQIYAPSSIFIQNSDAPDSAKALFYKGSSDQSGLVEAGSLHTYADFMHRPRLESVRASSGSLLVDGVCDWSRDHLGVEMMDWQRHVIGGILGYDGNGDLLHRQALVSVARQNGKSTVLEAIVGYWLTVMSGLRGVPQTVITTAHNLSLATELFLKLAPILEAKFSGVVQWSVGRSEVNFVDGTRWLVRAATPTSFHGLTADLCCIDETWAVSADSVSMGLMPTMRTRRSPLMLMTSTAGDQSSLELLRWREKGLQAVDSQLQTPLYFAEYSPPNNGIDPMTEPAWRYANPAIGSTIDIEVLRAEAEQPNRAAFLRSSVNLWIASANGWLQPGVWEALKTGDPMPAGGVLAIEQSQDESRYVGVRAAMNSHGKIQVSTEFVKDTLAECYEAVETACKDQTTRLLITPSFEMSLPTRLQRRSQMVGNRELQRWTAPIRALIIEGKIVHDGTMLLAQHVERAVAVKNQGAVSLSSLRSPGPIELARCLIFAATMVAKPAETRKPMIVVASR